MSTCLPVRCSSAISGPCLPSALSDQFVVQVGEYLMEIPTIDRAADVSVTMRVRHFQHVPSAELSLVAMAGFNFEATIQQNN